MKEFSQYITEQSLSIAKYNDFWKDYILKNNQEVKNFMRKYVGQEVTHLQFRSTVSGKDSKGNMVDGVWCSYSTTDGHRNQDIYISGDGYVMMKNGNRQYDKNTYWHILPKMNVKLG